MQIKYIEMTSQLIKKGGNNVKARNPNKRRMIIKCCGGKSCATAGVHKTRQRNMTKARQFSASLLAINNVSATATSVEKKAKITTQPEKFSVANNRVCFDNI